MSSLIINAKRNGGIIATSKPGGGGGGKKRRRFNLHFRYKKKGEGGEKTIRDMAKT